MVMRLSPPDEFVPSVRWFLRQMARQRRRRAIPPAASDPRLKAPRGPRFGDSPECRAVIARQRRRETHAEAGANR